MRTSFILSFLAPSILLVCLTAAGQTSTVITIPAALRQDFEEGHISGWESYPPFQDSAFDPDFKCSQEDNQAGSCYALSRKVQIAFPTAYEIGFIRKVRMQVTPASSVAFDYLLRMYGDVRRMEAVVCAVNGKKYSCAIPSPVNDQWTPVTVQTSSFMHGGEALAPGVLIEAFYVLAYVEKTNPDVAYRFFLDNVVITGATPADFQFRVPGATVLEHWNKTVLQKHYTAGEQLSVTVSLPAPVTLNSVHFSLFDPHGKSVVDKAALSFRRGRNVWERQGIRTFSARDEKGRWRGKLWGEDGKGGHVETECDVWVTEKPQPHPRLYLGTDNADFYKRRGEKPRWNAWLDSIAEKAARLRTTSNLGSIVLSAGTSSSRGIPPAQWTVQSMAQVDLSVFDTTYLLPTLNTYYAIISPAMEILYDHALLYAIRKDPEAGNYGKNALLAIAGWNTWTHPWFRARHQESYYPVGELGVRAAFCYDVVAPLLSADERKSVQEGLMRNCVIPVYQEYVVENRIPSSTSNWIGNSVSGALSCILAMYGDTRAFGDFEPYCSGLLTKLEDHISSTLDTSGAWGEGMGYQAFAYSNVLPTITALTRVLHADLTTPALLRSYLFFLYNTTRSEVLDVGDSHPTLGTLSTFAWILSRNDDPILRGLYLRGPREHALDFLFGREDGRVMPPDSLPPSRLFPEIGGAVFRSGWSPDDRVLSFRCGAFYNHQHFHQGSFQLGAFGETLVPEAGVVHYYNDPWYQPYYIQAVGHNTVLLDENPGSQRSGDYLRFVGAAHERAKMQEFIGTSYYGAATGELHNLYRGDLALFERTVVFVHPGYVVLFDRLRSSGGKHTYDWLLHFDERKEVTVAGSDITIARGGASLLAKVLAPGNAAIDVKGAPTRLGVPITRPGYVQVRNVEKSTGEDFLVVLYPREGNLQNPDSVRSGSGNLSDAITTQRGENWLSARIVHGDAEDEILLRINDAKAPIHNDHLATDGRIVARTVRGHNLVMVAVHGATSFACDTVRLHTPMTGVEGTTRFTAAAALQDTRAEWLIQPVDAGALRFRCLQKPQRVDLNGRSLATFSWDNRSRELTIPVAKGENALVVYF